MADRQASLDLADEAGLRYVNDESAGYRRIKRGKGFAYLDPDRRPVSEDQRRWIESLAIPPAWSEVWISPDRRGHILATGKDDAGRKQYIYHSDWEQARDQAKFDRLGLFGDRLVRLRRRIDADLSRPGRERRTLERGEVVALAVAVLDQTLIRVGSRQYAEAHESYGLTTLTGDHVEVAGNRVRLAFSGKGGADREVAFDDRRLARLISRCQELDGQTLFSYQVDAGVGTIGSSDVNLYLAQATGWDFTAKDFRTWGATTTVVDELATGLEPDLSPEKRYLAAVDVAAERLGNTREVCRSSYVHPMVEAAFNDGRLSESWRRSRRGRWLSRPESATRRLLAADTAVSSPTRSGRAASERRWR